MPHNLLVSKEKELINKGWNVSWNEGKTVFEAINRNISNGHKFFYVINDQLVEEE